jgi:asparagine synthase (glutamine-hydrolysing)
MADMIRHRGPDDQGMYVDGPIGLGSTRLSIIDLGGGHQPMSNETGDVWLVFNGEIWNYRALRDDLLARGHRFRSQCDTETIIHAYEEYGTGCVPRLHGMFGFALWDAPRRRLLLARDRVGKKPLYYARVGESLIFASEIKAILCHPAVRRRVDVQALSDFLSVRYVPAPATLFAGIRKVLPGHWLLCEDGRVREECYWDFTFKETPRRLIGEYIQGIRDHVHRAVEERVMADVPVGALLSGGVDSSIVAGTMSRLTGHPVKTFAVGFDVRGFSELPYAELAARHFGTEHHELVVRSSDLSRWWPVLTWHRDEPVSEPSDLGVFLISRLARQHVKVVLTGEGGDELFAGYPKYVVDWLARYYHVLPAPERDRVVRSLINRLPYRMRKLKMAAGVLSQPAPERWMSWFGVFNGTLKSDLLSATTRAAIDPDASRAFRYLLETNPQRDDVSSMLYLDTKIWLPDNLLMKSDKMTMAASLEARVPLLDAGLIEYAASIPTGAKIRPFRAKYLFKRAFADFLPRPILERRKMGFNVPTGTWFRAGLPGLLTQLLLCERARSRGFLNDDCVARLLRDHLEGRTDYGNQLFLLASLELWFRVFIDGDALGRPERSVEEILKDDTAEVGVA